MPSLSKTVAARLAAAVGAVLVCLVSASAGEHRVLSPAQIEFTPLDPSDPNGGQKAVLARDPNGARPYVTRLRLPAGMVVPLHAHASPEFGTVLSGRIRMAFGRDADEASAHVLMPGSFVYLPAGDYHRLWVDEDSVIDVYSVETHATHDKH